MAILLLTDDSGASLKCAIEKELEVEYSGAFSSRSLNCPPIVQRALKSLKEGDLAIICSSPGAAIAANKIEGIIAVHATDTEEAYLARRHGAANVLVLSRGASAEMARVFTETHPESGGRHQRRVEQIKRIEANRL